MPARDAVINKLRSLGFKYKKTCDTTDLWKRGVESIYLPRNSFIEAEWVRTTLRIHNVSKDEIEEFLRHAKC